MKRRGVLAAMLGTCWIGVAWPTAHAEAPAADAGLVSPSQIVFIDGDTHKVVSTTPLSDVPESQRTAPTEDGGSATVVKVVMHRRGKQLEIKEYGEHGELLRTTLGFARGQRAK